MVQPILKEGRISAKKWNAEILPLVENKTLIDESKQLPKGFLMAYQAMEGLVKDVDGTYYRCVGWNPPQGEAYVDIKKYRPKN
jgi:hypothetical protein